MIAQWHESVGMSGRGCPAQGRGGGHAHLKFLELLHGVGVRGRHICGVCNAVATARAEGAGDTRVDLDCRRSDGHADSVQGSRLADQLATGADTGDFVDVGRGVDRRRLTRVCVRRIDAQQLISAARTGARARTETAL